MVIIFKGILDQNRPSEMQHTRPPLFSPTQLGGPKSLTGNERWEGIPRILSSISRSPWISSRSFLSGTGLRRIRLAICPLCNVPRACVAHPRHPRLLPFLVTCSLELLSADDVTRIIELSRESQDR